MNTSKDARKGFSAGQWPVDGGCDGSETCSYSELVITGHADGSIRYDFFFVRRYLLVAVLAKP